MKDDSTMFWAIGPESTVIAKQADFCGKEVEMVVPFEGVSSGEVTFQNFVEAVYKVVAFFVKFVHIFSLTN